MPKREQKPQPEPFSATLRAALAYLIILEKTQALRADKQGSALSDTRRRIEGKTAYSDRRIKGMQATAARLSTFVTHYRFEHNDKLADLLGMVVFRLNEPAELGILINLRIQDHLNRLIEQVRALLQVRQEDTPQPSFDVERVQSAPLSDPKRAMRAQSPFIGGAGKSKHPPAQDARD